jgi:hypothetical protein
MPKDTEQDIVLALAAHWQHILGPKLEDSVRKQERSLKSDFTSVVVSVTQRKEPDLTKVFPQTRYRSRFGGGFTPSLKQIWKAYIAFSRTICHATISS